MNTTSTDLIVHVSHRLSFEIHEILNFPTNKSLEATRLFNEKRRRDGFDIFAVPYPDRQVISPAEIGDGSLYNFYIRVPVGRFEEVWEELQALATE